MMKSLKTKMIIMVSAVLFVIFTAFGVFSYYDSLKIFNEKSNQNREYTLKAALTYANDYLDSREQIIVKTAKTLELL